MKKVSLLLVLFFVLLGTIQANGQTWQSLPNLTNQNGKAMNLNVTNSSKGQLQARAILGWDAQYLRVEVVVQDPTQSPAKNLARDFSNADHIAIYIDTTGLAAQERRTTPGSPDYIFILTPQNAFGDPLLTTYGYGGYEHLDLNLRSVRYQVQPTSTGYKAQIAIPWSLLKMQANPGQKVGLALVVRDVVQGKQQGEIATILARPHYNPSQWQGFSLSN